MNFYLISISFLLSVLSCNFVMAQVDTTDTDDLQNEQIDIIKAYEPVLIKANKLLFSATLPEIKDEQQATFNYNVPVKLLEVNYAPSKIKPLGIKGEEPEEVPIIYLKAGFGNYVTPLIDLEIANKNTDNFKVGLNVNHLSSNRRKIENQRFSETNFKVEGAYFVNKEITVGGSAFYGINNRFFYGYDHDAFSFTKDESKNGYTTGGGGFYVKGKQERSNLGYHIDFGIQNTKDGYDHKNLNLDIDLGVKKEINRFAVGADILLHHNIFTDTSKNGRFLLNLNPYFDFNHERFSLRGGGHIITDDGQFRVLPDVKLRTVLIRDKLVMYNEWVGKVNKNNLQTISEQNPYLEEFQTYQNGTEEHRTFIGLMGSTPIGIDFDTRVTQVVLRDHPLFLNNDVFTGDSIDSRKFLTIYDPKLSAWNAHIGLGYNHNDFLFFRTTFDYFNYNATGAEAWHLPQYQFNVAAVYHFDNKLILKADFYTLAGKKALLSDGNVEKLKATVDLNFSANYHLNKFIAFFANVNNALSLKRPQYYNYDNYGFQVVGGVILSY